MWVPIEDGEWFWSEIDKTVLDISDDGKTITIDDGERRLSKTFGNVPIRLCRQVPDADPPELDWDKATAHLEVFAKAYEDLGDTGRFGLAITIMPLQDRLGKGERTKWLYDEIMEVS